MDLSRVEPDGTVAHQTRDGLPWWIFALGKTGAFGRATKCHGIICCFARLLYSIRAYKKKTVCAAGLKKGAGWGPLYKRYWRRRSGWRRSTN